MSTLTWAQEDYAQLQLGDARLKHRACAILVALAQQPHASWSQACGAWAATKACYRFVSNRRVNADKLRQATHQATVVRAQHAQRVLAIQDTTTLDLTSQAHMSGLGPLYPPPHQGLLVHSTLCVNDTGVPLGLLDQQVWARDPDKVGQGNNWRKRALADKESQKWTQALAAVEAVLSPEVGIVHIGDREADLFPLLAAPRRPGSDLLVRVAYNRRLKEEAHLLFTALAQAPVQAHRSVTVRRRQGQPQRRARLQVRWVAVTLVPPDYYQGAYEPVRVNAILAEEVAPPAGTEPVRWILLTSLPLPDEAAVQTCLQWYAWRWLIERLHYVLKSGCRLEALQLESAARWQVALALYTEVAWHLLWLTYQARQAPDASCELVLAPAEWQALYCQMHQTTVPPQTPPCLREAVVWIARLGGFLARAGDGEPGVQTLWRGMQRLQDLTQMWELLHCPTYG